MNKIIEKLRKGIEKKLRGLRKENEEFKNITGKEEYNDINFAEDILDITFPESFRRFLFKKKIGIIRGHKIFGLPIDKKTPSILEMTKFLRMKRPDLLPVLIVISFDKNRTLCLDILNGNKFDAPIVEVFLKKNKPPILFSKSFKEFITTGKKVLRKVEIRNLKKPREKKIEIIR
ncbi:MAG: SMI1/KNR4 family protein [Candidatus Heimdallarchaeaceae archaeon]